jgi:CotH protein.
MRRVMKKKFWAMIMLGAAINTASCAGIMALGNTVQAAQEETALPALAVTMSKESGCYPDAFSLDITCEGAEKIFYTMDGSNPMTSGTRKEYTGAVSVTDRKNDPNVLAAVEPVLFDCAYSTYNGSSCKAPADNEVDKATVIKAVGIDASGNYSGVVTNTYFVGSMAGHIQGIEESCKAAGIPLAIMSVSMDYNDLFDYEKGIYVRGKVFEDAYRDWMDGKNPEAKEMRNLEANYTQRGSEWERPAHIDYLESDGKTTSCKLQQDCGIRIQGNYSRSDLQKGFRLYAKKEYGEKNFNYPFFGEDLKDDTGATMDKFKKLTLRNGGNASFLAKYNDAYWQSLLKDLHCDTQGSRACVVYLDGEYWGIYILQEEYSDDYFEDTHGVVKEDVVVYKGDAEKYDCGYKLEEGMLPKGETDQGYYLSGLTEFFKSHSDLIKEEDYQEFSKLVDIDSVRDYFAAQIWMNNKWDWPGKNWTMWKTIKTDVSNPYADGRWRLCFYDLDFGGISGAWSAYDNTIQADNYKEYGLLDMDTKNPAVLCFAYLMSNEGFRGSFKQRITEFDKGIFEKNAATKACERYLSIYQPLYQQYFTRFFGAEKAERYAEEAVTGGYGSYTCITEFINGRSEYLPVMLEWVDEFYKTHTVYNSKTAAKKKTIKNLSVTAKKGTEVIKIKTIKKAKVVVTVSQKIIKSGKKAVKKLVIKPAKNKNGTVSVKLSKKLKKGIKVTAKVTKEGYKAKTKTITIK